MQSSGAKEEARQVSKTSDDMVGSPTSGDEDEVDDKRGGKKKGKKRRRVVVACDTCRRKKVKCEGLPNSTNTCHNCHNMGYSCTFTVEPDRSRGRYEILEAQKDTLLAALRSVAPDMAEQFERGELPTGNMSAVQADKLEPLTDVNEAEWKKADVGGSDSLASGLGLEAAEAGAATMDGIALPRERKRNVGPMIPDLEDGRPRYFGGGSNLSSFHNFDSRPPSPGTGHRQGRVGQVLAESSVGREAGEQASTSTSRTLTGDEGTSSSSISRLAVLPRPRPQYPSNSIGWVRHIRRKTLVAIGRDELYGTDDWFQRCQFPPASLLAELLDFYFQQLNPVFPIIHEHSLRKDLAQGRAEKDSAFRGLVFTIIAISSRFFEHDPRVLADSNDPSSAGDHWAAASRFHHQVYAASLINVQVLLLSTMFMPSTLGVGTGWTVLGVAIRALQDIGLHTEKAYSEYTPFEQEMRRRAFWAAFVLDGILSINMGRPAALRLSDTSVKFPILASEDALMRAESGGPIEEQSSFDLRPCLVAGFIHTIKLRIISEDVVNTLYSPRWKQEGGVPTAGNLSGHQRKPGTYKDLTVLSKQLDEWEAGVPSYLNSIETSPYKLQACLIQLERHDVRLCLLKPFLQDNKPPFPLPVDRKPGKQEDSILKKMVLPQCTSHARECLRLIGTLARSGKLSRMVYIFQQAFLSAATFMLTIWHGTKDIEALNRDGDLIETTLLMLRPDENLYCSSLLRRAQRILCSIAQRALRGMKDEEQKKRMQVLIDLHDMHSNDQDSRLFGGASLGGGQGNAVRQSMTETLDRNTSPSKEGTSAALSGDSAWDKWETRWPPVPTHADLANSTAAEVPPYQPGDASAKDKVSDDFLGMGQWAQFDDPFSSSLRNDPSEIPHGFGFTTDMAWTDYFSKFLGGLPDPGNSPPTSSGVTMSPLVSQTP